MWTLTPACGPHNLNRLLSSELAATPPVTTTSRMPVRFAAASVFSTSTVTMAFSNAAATSSRTGAAPAAFKSRR